MKVSIEIELDELDSVTFAIREYVEALAKHAESLPPKARVSVNEEIKRCANVLTQIRDKASKIADEVLKAKKNEN